LNQPESLETIALTTSKLHHKRPRLQQRGIEEAENATTLPLTPIKTKAQLKKEQMMKQEQRELP